MPRFITLYSGSSGNSCVVEEDGRFLLIDIGGSCKATVTALASVGLSIQDLSGILITHEHSDHVKGLRVFLKKTKVPVYAGAATLGALEQGGLVEHAADLIAIDGRMEEIDGFTVQGFSTSHDSVGCCGYRIRAKSGSVMAIATDLGKMSELVYEHMEDASLVALEANYDRDMLRMGPYPYYLKKRIESPRGHLCNEDSAEAVAHLVKNGCRKVVLCHLSNENNHPNMVLQSIDQALFSSGQLMPEDCVLQVARRYEPGDWMEF